MPFAIKPGQTLLFTGDSITDAGRRDSAAPLGSGYVRMAADLIMARYPKHRLNVINTGISGNTVRDLFNRWSDDVIRHQPDWLSIMIGINDLFRWYHQVPGQSVSPEEYAELYPKILERVRRETKAQLVLIDPFFISNDRYADGHRTDVLKKLEKYRATVHRMVRQFKARHVKMHDMFQAQIAIHPPDRFAPEPVHPNPTGHLLMAHEWLKAVGW